MKGYRFRIWVRFVAVIECIYLTFLLIGVATQISLTVIFTINPEDDYAKGLLVLMSRSFLFPYTTYSYDEDSSTIYWLLTIRSSILAVIYFYIATCLVRGSSKKTSPTEAIGLIKIWRNWTIVLSILHALDYMRYDVNWTAVGVDWGILAGVLILVGLYSWELHQSLKDPDIEMGSEVS